MPMQQSMLDRRALISGRIAESRRSWSRRRAPRSRACWCRRAPSGSTQVEAAIAALAGCEIHARDPKGKLVVVMEATTAGALGATLNDNRAAAGCVLGLARVPRDRCRRPRRKADDQATRSAPGAQARGRRDGSRRGRHRESGARAKPRHRALGHRTEMGQGAVPLLRHRLQRDGCDQGQSRGRHARRHQVGGQPRPQLREGLFPLQDHVRPRPADASRCCARRTAKYDKNGEFTPVSWDEAFTVMAEKFKAALKKQGPERRRHVRLRPVDDLGRLCGGQAVQGRLPLQQHRSQRAPLHGLRRRWASCAPSASTSRWAATTTSRRRMPSCCGARTWPRCIRCCGRG